MKLLIISLVLAHFLFNLIIRRDMMWLLHTCIHWKLSSNAGFDVVKNWWQHHLDSVLKNDVCRILWDYTILLVHHWHITGLILHIQLRAKTKHCSQGLLFLAILAFHIRWWRKGIGMLICTSWLILKLWQTSASVVPIVIGVFGSIP